MKMNDIVYDSENKEVVRITNGIEKDGVLVPTEALAVRVLGIMNDGRPQIGLTYRKVDATKLSPVMQDSVFSRLHEVSKHFHNVGRV